jgi:hypothetical protein
MKKSIAKKMVTAILLVFSVAEAKESAQEEMPFPLGADISVLCLS